MNPLFLLAGWVLTTALYSMVIQGALLMLARTAVVRPAHRVIVWRAALLVPALAAALGVGGSVRASTREPALSVTSAISRIVPTPWSRRFLREDVASTVHRPLVRTASVSDPLAQSVSLLVLLTCAGGMVASTRRLRRRRSEELAVLRTRVVLEPRRTIGGIEVRVSCAEVSSPLALRGREICVPMRGFFTLPAQEQESVLLHEASHVERADAAWLELAHLSSAVLWWQPFNGGVINALIADTELAADDRALSLGASPSSLVSALMHLAATPPSRMHVGAAFVAGGSPLVKRSRRILGFDDPVAALGVRLLAEAILIVGATALLSVLPIPATSRGIPACNASAPAPACSFVRDPDVRVTQGDQTANK